MRCGRLSDVRKDKDAGLPLNGLLYGCCVFILALFGCGCSHENKADAQAGIGSSNSVQDALLMPSAQCPKNVFFTLLRSAIESTNDNSARRIVHLRARDSVPSSLHIFGWYAPPGPRELNIYGKQHMQASISIETGESFSFQNLLGEMASYSFPDMVLAEQIFVGTNPVYRVVTSSNKKSFCVIDDRYYRVNKAGENSGHVAFCVRLVVEDTSKLQSTEEFLAFLKETCRTYRDVCHEVDLLLYASPARQETDNSRTNTLAR